MLPSQLPPPNNRLLKFWVYLEEAPFPSLAQGGPGGGDWLRSLEAASMWLPEDTGGRRED